MEVASVLKGPAVRRSRKLQAAGFMTCFLAACLASKPVYAELLSVTLDIDAADVIHGVQHAHLTLPVTPGPLVLAYPKWIPGEHAPNGPITQLVELRMRTGGLMLSWRRDPLDAFAFHVTVPPGAATLDVDLDYVSPPSAFGLGFGKSADVTANLLTLMFNPLLLYPPDRSARDVTVSASVRLPSGWDFESALPVRGRTGDTVSLRPVTLAELVDAPMLAGRFLRRIPLTQGPHAVRLTVAADRAQDVRVGDGVIASLSRLPAETRAVFGPEPYRSYRWQVALSDALRHDGTEHAQSSDIREAESLFTEPDRAIDWRLFPHEYVHAWNGKFRRPVGLDTRNYQQPMDDSLLWMYEGLTRYYGDLVLTARSGLASAAQSRDYLAYVAAQMSVDRPGRDWRPLADTAVAVPAFTEAPTAWTGVRRGADYYNEMLLVWLEADMLIRQTSSDRSSLDDFCRRFFAGVGVDGAPAERAYDRSDIVRTLHAVAPIDWDRFLATRIDEVVPEPPLAGLHASGWRLVFDDHPNPFLSSVERLSSVYDFSTSLGMWVGPDGVVRDILPASPAYAAGLAAGMQLLAINGHSWTSEAAQAAILQAEHGSMPIRLEASSGGVKRTLDLSYHSGLRRPHLVRDTSEPDRLGEVLAPRAVQDPSRLAGGADR